MKFSKGKCLLSSTLAAGLLLSAAVPIHPLADKPELAINHKKVERVLANLTDEQKQALNQLNASPSFTIAPDVKVKSPGQVSVIVEFKQAPAKVEVKKQAVLGKRMTIASAEDKVDQSHKEFKSFVNSLKKTKSNTNYDAGSIKINREYKNAFNGVSMTLPGVAVQDLIKSGVVKRIWNNKEIQLSLPPESKGASPKMADSVPQIGVDKLHDESITGKGIKVGVIDTGIDYNHPDLSNAYKGYRSKAGENPKDVDPSSVKGWDFVDNDADPMETTYQDWKGTSYPEYYNGSAYYTSHGTHVSGTIAATKANKVDYAVEGVAPDVDLYTYRVLGPYGSGTDESVIAGIDKAVSDGMDVINLSLGSSVNDPLDPTSIAINHAMLSGVVSVVAAGNAGPNPKTLGSPGTAALGITVGASDSAMNIPSFIAVAGKNIFNNMMLLGKNFSDRLEDLTGKSLNVVSTGIGQASDFEGKDVKGKIALIERGTLTFDEKIKNAKAAGAKAAIIYNNVDGEITAYAGENTKYIPTFRLTKEEGEKIKALANPTITFAKLGNIKTTGDNLADFSSRGPVIGNYDIKPDVVAPGVSIFSTVPEYINSPEEGIDYSSAYERMQGTSMATPHVAGVAALILQEHKDYDPFEVKEALMNTSVDLRDNHSVYEVGAGRIDAYYAVHTDTSIKVFDKTEMVDGEATTEIDEETGSIAFGREYIRDNNEAIENTKQIEIKNKGNKKTYSIEVEFNKNIKGVQDAKANGVKLNVKKSITVGKGTSKVIDATITVPATAKIGAYEGYLHFTNEDNTAETYQVPFSITVTDKGIDFVATDSPSVANDIPFWQYYSPFINAMFSLKSPMKTLDVILKDTKTGDPIGYIGSLNAPFFQPDKEYYILWAFTGHVYPFTNDSENPISNQLIKLPEGDYTLEFIGSDESGKTYSIGTTAMVDNTAPDVKWDHEPGVYELSDSMFTVEDGQKAFYVHGKVNDANVPILQNKGLNIDQSSNTMFYDTYKFAYFAREFPINANGDVKFGIEESDIKDEPLYLSLATMDVATAMNPQSYVFLKEGTQYVESTYDKKQLKQGDTFTMTLSVNNVKQLLSGEYKIQYLDDYYQFKNVKLTKEIKQYAKSQGLDVSLTDPVLSNDDIYNYVNVGAKLSGKAFKGLDGDMPIVDVTFKLIDDTIYGLYSSLDVSEASYVQYGEEANTTLPHYSVDRYTIISKHSTINGSIQPEAFLTDEGYIKPGNITKLGIKVYVQSRAGKKYPGTLDDWGQFTVRGVPASNQEYTLVVETPSHLKSYTNFTPGKDKDGELLGQFIRILPNKNFAGDINGDKVVDIKDIQLVVDAYGIKDKSIVKEDINQDGVVDEKDVRLVEKNFLTKGPDAPENKQPKEKIGNKGIEYFLRLIGLETKN
ncbi:S8 family serine peptidase [Heyndrickxia sporothermodurans]